MPDSGNQLSPQIDPAIEHADVVAVPTIGTDPEDTTRTQRTYEVIVSITAADREALDKQVAEFKATAKDLGWTILPNN